MSLVLLPNTIQVDAAYLAVTDTSNVATTDTAGLDNITGGDRRLAWSSSDTGARRLAQVNKAGGLSCTHVVGARMDQHASKAVSLISWTAYPGTATTEFSTAAFGETLVGLRGQDWVREFSTPLSGKQGIALSLNSTDYVKNVYKFYVSNGITLTNALAPSYRPLPKGSRYVFRRQMFLVESEWKFTVEKMSRVELDAFESIPNMRSEPVFLYDSAGAFIYHKLIHGVISEYEATPVFDDFFQVNFTILGLSHWV